MPAFVFPGQGSQQPGMGRPWVDHPSWELVADASAAVDRDLTHLLLYAGAEELTETRNAQLATLTTSLVILDAVERLGIEPSACAGHSVGEYSALVAAGVLGFEDGARLVAERGEAMQAAADAEPGVMTVVIGTDAETADIACRLADGPVWLANDNSPDEVVIAGAQEAVREAGAEAIALGGRSLVPVPVGGAFHTPLMHPARARLAKALKDAVLREPEVPVVANVDARTCSDPAGWTRRLLAQLTNPVRWRHSLLVLMELLADRAPGDQLVVQLGPGSLDRHVLRTLPRARVVSVATPDDLDRLVDAVAGDTRLHAFAAGHAGEHLYVSERVVISPAAGLFEPRPDLLTERGGCRDGAEVGVGSLLGTVSGEEVRSPFEGCLMGMLAERGERVQPGQPVAWLRVL